MLTARTTALTPFSNLTLSISDVWAGARYANTRLSRGAMTIEQALSHAPALTSHGLGWLRETGTSRRGSSLITEVHLLRHASR